MGQGRSQRSPVVDEPSPPAAEPSPSQSPAAASSSLEALAAEAMSFDEGDNEQLLREDDGWKTFLNDVTSFCVKHDIKVAKMDGFYKLVVRSKRFFNKVKNLHRFHVEMFLSVVDRQLRELNDKFDESIDVKVQKALDCPCVADLKSGPCGSQFVDAFSCFLRSTEVEKGSDCVKPFIALQDCIKANPVAFSKEILEEEENDEEAEKSNLKVRAPAWSREPKPKL